MGQSMGWIAMHNTLEQHQTPATYMTCLVPHKFPTTVLKVRM
jgi:hypothetical protein